jgi:hypothetical protein
MRPFSVFVFLEVFLYLTRLQAQHAGVEISGAPLPIRVLAQSPADTTTELQVICQFRSSPVNVLHGSLAETNEKLNGLQDRVRSRRCSGASWERRS